MRAALTAALAGLALLAATPAPVPPKVPLHTEYVVEINKLGQVTRVRSGKRSADPMYNAETYGNALQAFIRTPDGKAVVGTYRLSYDYSPKTQRIHRDVLLVKAGGVNPDAKGAVGSMEDAARARPSAPVTPLVAPSFVFKN